MLSSLLVVFKEFLKFCKSTKVADEDEEGEELARSGLGEQLARTLYGLIHARYILTSSGMDRMKIKWDNRDFGCCPRVYCNEQNLLPIGKKTFSFFILNVAKIASIGYGIDKNFSICKFDCIFIFRVFPIATLGI